VPIDAGHPAAHACYAVIGTSGQVAGRAAHRALPITAAVLALAGILTGCTASVTTDGPPATADSTGSALAATAAPVTTVRPAAAPAAPSTNPWTPSTCTWAIANLTNDAQLDRAAAAHGTDPRWPTGTPAYYLQSAAQWDQVRYLVTDLCQISTGVPAGATVAICTDAMAWSDQARANHTADLARVGATANDQAWDRGWAAFYTSLSADIRTGCGHD
jgi:hypothetical protein